MRAGITRLGFALVFVLSGAASAAAVAVGYSDEAQFLGDLAALGYVAFAESFEDDVAWGAVRSPMAAPSVTNLGVTWFANNPDSELTTSMGPPRTGAWGFYSIPHGSYATGSDCHLPGNCGDGFIGTSVGRFVAVGGWITGFFGAKLEVSLNGDLANPVDFGEDCDPQGENCVSRTLLGNQHKFFGVIDLDGFGEFQFREVEGTAGDQKFMWADDFRFVVIDAPACGDGTDNDSDGLADFPADPGCLHAADAVEDPQCQDGLDNDADGLIDFDGGLSIHGPGAPELTDPDPNCVGRPWHSRERVGGRRCGLGFELALLLPALLAWGGRRRDRTA